MTSAPATAPHFTGKIDGAVVKIGGSLVANRARLRALLGECVEDAPVAIVPGGGPFADAVRATQDALGLDDALAHRLALDAMGRMAEVFLALEPRLAIATSPEAAADALVQGRSVLWDPVALKSGHVDIAESWDVTSDSLALWLAGRLGVDRCIIVKSAKLPLQTEPAALARAGLVDAAFPHFAASFGGAIVIRGAGDFDQRHAA